jgi:hypothetical protein
MRQGAFPGFQIIFDLYCICSGFCYSKILHTFYVYFAFWTFVFPLKVRTQPESEFRRFVWVYLFALFTIALGGLMLMKWAC